ncbi:NUDIX hydrolase domain-like protein [Amylocystis lapponica]|nr:NUDIX hydrolase domain-like protein [Amylocystis lapponica]
MSTPCEVAPAAIDLLSEQSKTCIERLRVHRGETFDLYVSSLSLSSAHPYKRLAAVLLLLFERAGEIRVLLTTRSKALRAHPGQTALPGGKVDADDRDVIATAFREANEEVSLPLDCPNIHTVCILRPFLSSSKLLVTPVVALLTDISVLDQLKASEGEVAAIFDWPLELLLDPTLASRESLVPKGSEHWPYDDEYHSTSDIVLPFLENSMYRMHRFRSSASPIKGLTSEILILAAEIAYGRAPSYERYARGQLTGFGDILRILDSDATDNHFAVSGTSTPIGVAAGVSDTVFRE